MDPGTRDENTEGTELFERSEPEEDEDIDLRNWAPKDKNHDQRAYAEQDDEDSDDSHHKSTISHYRTLRKSPHPHEGLHTNVIIRGNISDSANKLHWQMRSGCPGRVEETGKFLRGLVTARRTGNRHPPAPDKSGPTNPQHDREVDSSDRSNAIW